MIAGPLESPKQSASRFADAISGCLCSPKDRDLAGERQQNAEDPKVVDLKAEGPVLIQVSQLHQLLLQGIARGAARILIRLSHTTIDWTEVRCGGIISVLQGL